MNAEQRLDHFAREWRVELEGTTETASSLLGFGTRAGREVVLKITRFPGDEWHCGAVTAAFAGQGMVRVYQHEPGAALFERLRNGMPLTRLVQIDDDEGATEVIATVIESMADAAPTTGDYPSVELWGIAFNHYLASGDAQLSAALVKNARQRFLRLCETQKRPRLLHGDLHHENILFDEERGWTAIDPKGVLGEVEYELGAALRNPAEAAQYFTAAAIAHRVRRYQAYLGIDSKRVLEWCFAQAVLSAIWTIQDEGTIARTDPAMLVVAALTPGLG